MSTTIYVVEIPHQLPADVYESTQSRVIERAYGRDNFRGNTFDEAVEFLAGDRHTFLAFDTLTEALEWAKKYASQNGHQSARVLGELEQIKEDRAPQRVVSIWTDTGHYYESYETFDIELQDWCGDDFLELTEENPGGRAEEHNSRLEVDVSEYQGMEGTPVASLVLIGDDE